MSRILLKLGLVLIPFYEVLVRLLPYVAAQVPNTRMGKVFLGMWLALAIGLSAIYSGSIKKCQNIYILFFIAIIPLSIQLAPRYPLQINGIDSTNFWVWRPFLTIVCYFLMFMYVQSMNITRKSLSELFSIISWVAVVMAGYCILQNFGLDQFYNVKTGGQFDFVTKPELVGTMGNSTIVSPFLAMIIPITLYLRRCISAITIIVAVCLSMSSMAIGAMIVSLGLYSLLRWRTRAIFLWVIIASVSILAISVQKHNNPAKFTKSVENILSSNGRLTVWKDSFNIMRSTKLGEEQLSTYPYTGAGLGSYPVIIRPLRSTKYFQQAHNDYLELFVGLGILGLGLFILAILKMTRGVIGALLTKYNYPENIAIFSSFVCISLVAFGTFIWQISPHNFYTVILVGLLHNELLIKGDLND